MFSAGGFGAECFADLESMVMFTPLPSGSQCSQLCDGFNECTVTCSDVEYKHLGRIPECYAKEVLTYLRHKVEVMSTSEISVPPLLATRRRIRGARCRSGSPVEVSPRRTGPCTRQPGRCPALCGSLGAQTLEHVQQSGSTGTGWADRAALHQEAAYDWKPWEEMTKKRTLMGQSAPIPYLSLF